MDLWFTTSVSAGTDTILVISAGVPTCVPDIFCFGCSTNSVLLNSSSSSLLPVLLASDFVSCLFCSLDSSWYSDRFSLI